MKGAQTFQSVDFISNSSKEYFPNLRKQGPGGTGFIFQFYWLMEEEGSMMMRGLGIYLLEKYGEETISPLFSAIHWDENKHWAWDDEKKTFVTPDKKSVAELVHLDSNAAVIGKEATILANEDKQANENSNWYLFVIERMDNGNNVDELYTVHLTSDRICKIKSDRILKSDENKYTNHDIQIMSVTPPRTKLIKSTLKLSSK